ncbi:hypothetical protein ACI5KX_14445 [Erythrobacter sp. GH1-10]
MCQFRYNSSRPDSWVMPRQPLDPSVRALAYGRVRPMHEPSWLERLMGRY